MKGNVYVYVVARDFGFAPNPFHGFCTLATCKPRIRAGAQVGDWILGMGGADLNAVCRCIYAMRITDALSFDEYWEGPRYRCKRPVRNGSRKTAVGDNIYHRDPASTLWLQEDSHHSQPNGSQDPHNVEHDTQTDRVLISEHFYYFGRSARLVPGKILDEIGYRNARNHRVFALETATPLISWLEENFGNRLNHVMGDPYQFESSSARYSSKANKVI
jgi:hypothetical protein